MSTWPEVPLASVAAPRGLVGGPFGSSLVGVDYVPSGVPVIRGGNMGRQKQLAGEFVFVSREKLARDLTRNTAVPNDVIFTQRGTLGQVAIAPDTYPLYVVSQSQMRLRVDTAKALSHFIFYACSTDAFNKQINDQSISTGVPHINLGILSALLIPLPPLAQQEAIATMLGALDDKIAANGQLAQIGDELVRTRFDLLVAASPDRGPLSDVATNPRELVEPASIPDCACYVGLEHIPRRQMWLSTAGSASQVSSTKSRFQEGDVLFGKLRPYFHKVVAAPTDGICSTDILVVRAKEPDLAGFVLAAASSDEVVRRSTSASEGTRMPRTNWRDVAAVEIPWPGLSAATAFSKEVMVVRDLVQQRMRESAVLAKLRDALLPQLMSGRLRVKDAEERVEEVL